MSELITIELNGALAKLYRASSGEQRAIFEQAAREELERQMHLLHPQPLDKLAEAINATAQAKGLDAQAIRELEEEAGLDDWVN